MKSLTKVHNRFNQSQSQLILEPQETIHETPEVLHQVKTNEFQNLLHLWLLHPRPCRCPKGSKKSEKSKKSKFENSSPMVDAVKNATVPKEFAELEPNLHSPPNAIAQSLENFASRQDAALTKLSHQARADSFNSRCFSPASKP